MVQNLSDDCLCRAAVERTYRELRDRNETDMTAFDAATRVYRWHYPGVSRIQARFSIAEWLDQGEES